MIERSFGRDLRTDPWETIAMMRRFRFEDEIYSSL